MQLQHQLDQMGQHLIERDKEIRLYRMKLKDMMATASSGVALYSSQATEENSQFGRFQAVQDHGSLQGKRLLSIDVPGKIQKTSRIAVSTEMAEAKLP